MESFSPVLAHKANVEFAPLQIFAGVAHDLIEGVLQQVVSADDEPEDMKSNKLEVKLDLVVGFLLSAFLDLPIKLTVSTVALVPKQISIKLVLWYF